MKILIACEESQAICNEMRKRGHECYSADLQKCSGGHPEWHILGDCIPLINGHCEFVTQDGKYHRIDSKWDMIIAHPPCTYLASSGVCWCNVERYGESAINRIKLQEEAIEFFMKFVNADCDHIAIENPIGIMSTSYRKPDQIVHPWWFGENEIKSTCLWLKDLPPLQPKILYRPDIEQKEWISVKGKKKYMSKFFEESLSLRGKERQKFRSKTFSGIAKAIAEQWGKPEIIKYKKPKPRILW